MKISLDWLGDFIDITEKDNQKIKDIITERSAEIETMQSLADSFGNVVVGELLSIEKHPDADKLSVTKVNIGKKEPIQVIFGKLAQMEVGSKVPVAVAPTRLRTGHVIERSKLRGITSEGMLCLDRELGLAEEGDSIHRFTTEAPGTPLVKILGLDDVVLDIDNHAITNRSDLFSHRGFAREFVANYLGKWKKGATMVWEGNVSEKLPKSSSPAPIELKIEDKEACSHYMGVYLTGIEVKEGPEWMKKRLIACGVNPISNIVDITNYVMLELGMPMHAFDLDQVKGKKWKMRRAKKGEKMITVDEKKHELKGGEVVLDDGNELFDLCGIMGGHSSGINQHTKSIWLHSPVYDPTMVRQGMRGLGHISDAAIVYEKGVDPELAGDGLYRAMELILELCPNAKVTSEVMDLRGKPKEQREIKLSLANINRLIGVNIEPKKIEKILSDLGFEVSKSKDGYKVQVPSYRHNDVHMEADVIEEIARIYGFNNIPYKSPVKAIDPVSPSKDRRMSREIKWALTGFGYNEIYTFAFLGPELLGKCGMEVTSDMVEIENPISSDMSLMRTSLLPRMMDTIADNLRYKGSFKLFELNKVYHRKSETDLDERPTLIMAVVNEDFRVLQGAAEALGVQVSPVRSKERNPAHHPGRTGELVVRGQVVGHIYEVHPQILKNFDIKPRVTVAEIDLQAIFDMDRNTGRKYQELAKYPSVQLDVSMVIPKKNMAGDYLKTIQKTDQKLITEVELIDEYTGDKISADKRGLTYSITYQAADRTLKDAEVEAVHKQVLERLKKNGAEIR